MESESDALPSLEMPEAVPLRFGDLAGLIARVRHVGETELAALRRAVAATNIEEKLKELVACRALTVRNPTGMTALDRPMGRQLQEAMLIPTLDLAPLREAFGIGIRFVPFGTGPTHWTIENAAAAIAEQEGWHHGARDTLRDQMMQAARDGTLTVRHPHTDLPYRPKVGCEWYEQVTPEDVNAWLSAVGARYRWATTAIAPAPSAPVSGKTKPAAIEPVPDEMHAPVPAAGPYPLTTGDIAFCFDGLRWSEAQWKKPLGDKRKWLVGCIATPGLRGVRETRWNPVLIGGALVHHGYVKARSVRAKFQTKPMLKPWFETWKTYEAENIDTD